MRFGDVPTTGRHAVRPVHLVRTAFRSLSLDSLAGADVNKGPGLAQNRCADARKGGFARLDALVDSAQPVPYPTLLTLLGRVLFDVRGGHEQTSSELRSPNGVKERPRAALDHLESGLHRAEPARIPRPLKPSSGNRGSLAGRLAALIVNQERVLAARKAAVEERERDLEAARVGLRGAECALAELQQKLVAVLEK